jgi:hypothetical protein
MKISERCVRNFALGILAALAGYALCACDGETSTEDGGVIPPNEPKALRCPIPSPTYDKTSMPQNGRAVDSVVVSNAAAVQQLCEAWTWIVPAGVNGAGQPYPASCRSPGSPECSVTMTADVCRNVADDFVDSAGGRHCFRLAEKLDGHGADECRVNTDNAVVRGGTATCELSHVSLMRESDVNNRMVEICSPDGRFVGWQCPTDAID